MEIRQLRTFRVVAEALNFTRAAESLHLAQSSVSAQIKGLEEDLGVKLFDRIGKSVTLTEAGLKLLDYAGRIEGMTEEIRGVLRQDQQLSGELVVRVPETVASVYLPEVTARYHQLNPHVKITYINCSDLQLAKELRSGCVDLAFLMTDELSMKDADVEFIKEETLAVIAPESHHLCDRGEVLLPDLAGETLLMPQTD